MFDDLFETTVWQGGNDPIIDTIYNDMFESSRYWYAEEDYESSGQLIYCPPPLTDVWLNERGRRERKTELGKQRNCQ